MFLLCYSCLRDRENNLPSTPFKIHTEFNKNVHAPMKPQLVISATRGWEYFAKDYLWTVFPGVLLWNPQAYSTEVGNCESAKKILFWEAKWNDVFFSKCFSKHSVKTRWWSLFVLRNADFFKFKNAWELSWGKVFLIRVLYREQIMRHGRSVTSMYCYRLYGLTAFSNRHAVLRKLLVLQQKQKFGTFVNISLT